MRTPILSLVLLTLFAAAAPAQKNEQDRPPIIDVHVHAYEKKIRHLPDRGAEARHFL